MCMYATLAAAEHVSRNSNGIGISMWLVSIDAETKDIPGPIMIMEWESPTQFLACNALRKTDSLQS